MITETQRHIIAALAAIPLTVIVAGLSMATFGYIV